MIYVVLGTNKIRTLEMTEQGQLRKIDENPITAPGRIIRCQFDDPVEFDEVLVLTSDTEIGYDQEYIEIEEPPEHGEDGQVSK